MKKLFLLILFIIFAFNAKAQFKKGDFEFGFSGSFGRRSFEMTSTQSSPLYSESVTYFLISGQPSYYILDGLAIGMDFSFCLAEERKAAHAYLIDLSYTFPPQNSNLALYGHIGYGLGNAPATRSDLYLYANPENFNLKLFNTGAGLKILLSKSAFIKFELTYQNYSYKKEYITYFPTTHEYSESFFGLMYGIGITF